MQQHIDDELLERYVMQTLDPLEAHEVEGHLMICEDCQERLDDTADFVQSIAAAAVEYRQTQSPAKDLAYSGST